MRRRSALFTVVLGTVLCGIFWGAVPPRTAVHGGFAMMTMKPPTAADRKRDQDLRELHAMIPPNASVAVSEPEMPHISRLEMRSLRDTTDADYLLFGVGGGGWGATNAERVIASGEFERVAERPGLALARRKSTTPPWAGPPISPPAGASPPPVPPKSIGPRPMPPRTVPDPLVPRPATNPSPTPVGAPKRLGAGTPPPPAIRRR